MKLLVLAIAVNAAAAACPNQCSGHGSCGNDDICHCYQDWLNGDEDGGDCSKKKCPYGNAWVDTPSDQNRAHALAECSNRGICDRDSGDCQCFDGYTGSACRRTTCPNDCSGHGTCEYIKELRNDLGDDFKWTGDKPTTDQFQHELILMWDESKSRACVCDPKWTDIDCSRRMCPKGNYALYYDGGTTDTDGSSTNTNDYQETQTVSLTSKCDIPLSMDSGGMRAWGLTGAPAAVILKVGGTPSGQPGPGSASAALGVVPNAGGALTAASTPAVGDIVTGAKVVGPDTVPGAAYTTITAYTDGDIMEWSAAPMSALAQNDVFDLIKTPKRCNNVEFALTFRSTLNEEFTTKTLRQTDSALTVQKAINSLPNKVVEEAVVTKNDVTVTAAVEKTEFKVTFMGSMTTGDQYALECRTKPCGAGCNPRISNVLDAQIMANPYAGDNFDQYDTFPAYGSPYTDALGTSNFVGKVYATSPRDGAAASAITLNGLCPALQKGMAISSKSVKGKAGVAGAADDATKFFDKSLGYIVASWTDVTGVCVVTTTDAHGITFDVTDPKDGPHIVTFYPAVSYVWATTQAAPSKYVDLTMATTPAGLALPAKGDTLVPWGTPFKLSGASHAAGTGAFSAGYVTVVSVTGTVIELSAVPTAAITQADVLTFFRDTTATNNYGTARDVKLGGSCTVTDDTMLDSNAPKRLKALNTECSTRGHCAYDTGICQCFEGYTDEYCSTQAALI